MKALFDHLAVAAESLDEGAAAVEAALGVPLVAGGRHAAMGTHNRLLSLGPGEYLEVIAVDPAAPEPGRARWFDLDSFSGRTRPQCWIVRSDELDDRSTKLPYGPGRVLDFTRADLRWRMAVPDSGRLPFDNCFPALIEWQGRAHAADRLPDSGCALGRLVLVHPEAGALRSALRERLTDPRIVVVPGKAPGLRAEIQTPHGPRILE